MSDIPQTVAQAFIKTTTSVPEKEAIVSADGRRYSYAELRREVERIVQALQALDERTVVCPLGHTFPRDQAPMEATQRLEPTEESEDDAG